MVTELECDPQAAQHGGHMFWEQTPGIPSPFPCSTSRIGSTQHPNLWAFHHHTVVGEAAAKVHKQPVPVGQPCSKRHIKDLHQVTTSSTSASRSSRTSHQNYLQQLDFLLLQCLQWKYPRSSPRSICTVPLSIYICHDLFLQKFLNLKRKVCK